MEIALKNRRKTANSKEQYRLSRAGKLWILNAGDKIVGMPLELRKDDSLELHENVLTTAKGDMYQIHNGHGYISLKEIHVAGIESSLNSSAGNKTTHQADLVDVSKNKDISKRDADSKSIKSAYDKTNVVSEVSGRNVSETSCVVKVPVAGDEICSHGQVSGRRQLDGLDGAAHGLETASYGVVTDNMGSAKIPMALVRKMKRPKQGITPVINKIEKEFMVHVEFDGKEQVVLKGDKDILDLALDTLERDYDGAPSPDNGFNCHLGNTTVDWTFYGDAGATVDRLFTKELQELKKVKSVKVSSNPSSKQKYCLTIACGQESFPEIKRNVDSFSGSIIKPTRIIVASKDSSKAAQFVQDTDKEGIFCEFSDGKYLKIHGRTKADISRGEEMWKRRLAEPSQKNVTKINLKPAETERGKAGHKPKVTLAASVQQKVTDKIKQKTDAAASVVKFVESHDFKDGSNKVQYMINDTLNVFIYTMSVTDLKDIEAIVCTVNPDLQGGRLAEAIAQVGGSKYAKELEKMRANNAPLKDRQVLLCKEVGKLRVKAVLHLVSEVTVQDTSQGSMGYLSGLNRSVLGGATDHKIKKLAMSLIGAGFYIKAQRDIATLCSGLASDIIDFCLDSKEKRTLTELHLVNLDPGMTQTLLTEFRNRSQSIEPPPRSEFGQTGAYGGCEGRRDRYYGGGGGGGGGYRQYTAVYCSQRSSNMGLTRTKFEQN